MNTFRKAFAVALGLGLLLVALQAVAQAKAKTSVISDKFQSSVVSPMPVAPESETSKAELQTRLNKIEEKILSVERNITSVDNTVKNESVKHDFEIKLQNERIRDITFVLTGLAIVIGVSAGLANYFGYLSAGKKATEVINKLYEDQKKFIEGVNADIQNQKREFEKYMHTSKEDIQYICDDIKGKHTYINDEYEKFKQSFKRIDESMAKDKVSQLTADEKQAFQTVESQLKKKPVDEYTPEDWNTRAYAAYSEGKFALAAEYWGQVALAKEVNSEMCARALYNKGIALGKLKRYEEAITSYEEILARFGQSIELALQVQVAKALAEKGVALGRLRQDKEAIEVYDDFLTRFGQSSEPALQVHVAQALRNKGVFLGRLRQNKEAIAAYGDLLARFGQSADLALQVHVASALVGMSAVLANMMQFQDVIDVCNSIQARYGQTTEVTLQKSVLQALNNKGHALRNLEQYQDAITVYEELLARVGQSSEPDFQEQVSNALNGKGFSQLCEAKRNWSDEASRQTFLEQALANCEKALVSSSDITIVLGNQGYALFLLGRKDEAKGPLRKALKDGGQRLRDAELEDAEISPVPEDEEFITLINELWDEIGKEAPQTADKPA